MGRKCNVLDCPSDSRRPEDNGVTFHKMPFHSDLRPKWIELCRIPEERQSNKVIYVCSRHFRRTDFCNFKGTKYMLKQGALPSVFPWTRSLLKITPPSEDKTDEKVMIKEEPVDTDSLTDEQTNIKVKEEVPESEEKGTIKKEIEEKPSKVKQENASSSDVMLTKMKDDNSIVIDFCSGTRIEANDFNDKWYPATILEVDYPEKEVFVEFDRHLNRANEWIPMDSSRLRPYVQPNTAEFVVGEKCMATWMSSCSKYPATIKKVLDGDSYEVLFDDGFTKILKQCKLSKIKDPNNIPLPPKAPVPHAAPLFDPVVGSKEERRKRKRKLNVAQLFGYKKKLRTDDSLEKLEDEKQFEDYSTQSSSSPAVVDPVFIAEGEEWTCRWLNGEPIGIESTLESPDGQRRSIIVPDHRLPTGWEKHLTQRMYGNSAGKWDAILVNPDGKKFANRQQIKIWMDENKVDFNVERFDFSLHINRAKKLGLYEITDPEIFAAVTKPNPIPRPSGASKNKNARSQGSKLGTPAAITTIPEMPVLEPEIEEEDENVGSLKIIHENNSYKCPIEGCGKNFRKENLAQMHIKHYHPEYSKLIGSTPNVADLAYARTVGENIDEMIPSKKSITSSPLTEKDKNNTKIELSTKQKSSVKILAPKSGENFAQNSLFMPKPVAKDSEIIRLLNSEPKTKMDAIFDNVDSLKHLTSEEHMTPADKYPEIKLRDLLSRSEPVPHKKDEYYRPHGIKTLLPVVRMDDQKMEQDLINDQSHVKVPDKGKTNRKRSLDGKRRQSIIKYDTDEMSDCFEGDSHSQDSFKIKTTAADIPPPMHYQDGQVIIEGGEVIRLVHMRSEEIINCTCGITEEDGLMIQCELCLCWQHAHCNNIAKENEVPEKYICKICKNPQRMRSSKRYYHDQDWLKLGVLATGNYHSKDQDMLAKRFESLRKSHELSGCLVELNDYLHNLRVKLNIAENKDHPKLYLWNKPWEKPEIISTFNLNKLDSIKKEENLNSSFSGSDHSYMKSSAFGELALKSIMQSEEIKIKEENAGLKEKIASESELISILEDDDCKTNLQQNEFPKIDLNAMIANNLTEKGELKDEAMEDKEEALNAITSGILSSSSLELTLSQSDLERLSTLAQLSDVVPTQEVPTHPVIPQPEDVIDPLDCRLNLLEHVGHFQKLVDERLDAIEIMLNELDEEDSNPLPDTEANSAKIKQTIQMLIRDLGSMRQIAAINN